VLISEFGGFIESLFSRSYSIFQKKQYIVLKSKIYFISKVI